MSVMSLGKRICIICYEASERVALGPGQGMSRYTWQLLKNFKQMEETEGIEFLVLRHGPSPRNLLLRNIRRLLFFAKVKNVKASLYHAITPILGIPLALFNKTPFIVTVHDLLHFCEDYGNPYRVGLDLTYFSHVLDKASSIITTANYWKRKLVSIFDFSSRNIYVVYNGVDIKRFKPIHGLRTKGDTKKILFVGSPTKLEGLYTLIKAAALSSRGLKDLKLVIGGKVPYHDLAKLCKKLGVSAEFLGFIPEEKLPQVYNMADIFVNPPTDECSLMLLEAAACGTPVIARDIFQTHEYLGDASMLIRSNDLYELSDAIIRLLTDRELWFKLSKKGLERVRQFTWRRMAEDTFKVYPKVM